MKKILGIAAIIGAVAYFGKKKVDNYQVVFSKLKVKFLGLSGLSFSNGNITFKTTLQVLNPSNIPLDIATGNAVTLRRLLFYNNVGEFLGEATPNLSAIQIPAKSSIELKNIHTEVPITEIEDLFGTALSIFQDTKNLKVKVELEALGKIILIDA